MSNLEIENAILDIVSVRPSIEGRFPQNGLRYSIPLRLVSDMKLINLKNNQDEKNFHSNQDW